MKLNPALAKSLLMAAAIGIVVPMRAAPTRRGENENAESAPERLPRRADIPPVVPGVHAMREDGSFIALAIENGKFTLRFLDAKKWKVEPQAKRALLRFKRLVKDDEERTVLNPNGNDALVGSMFIRPPYAFKVFVTLIGDDDKAIETVSFNYNADSE